jgi:hypothetical protein
VLKKEPHPALSKGEGKKIFKSLPYRGRLLVLFFLKELMKASPFRGGRYFSTLFDYIKHIGLHL